MSSTRHFLKVQRVVEVFMSQVSASGITHFSETKRLFPLEKRQNKMTLALKGCIFDPFMIKPNAFEMR